MRILLSNDDGVQAPGITALARALSTVAEVYVVAPDRDRSGASNSLTLDRPLRLHQLSDRVYSVNGTPTDCVHLAITGLLDQPPDMVIAGVNAGANMGDDVLYSGTVAAAMEGRFLGYPAIAVSLVERGNHQFETACEVVLRLLSQLRSSPLSADSILNVNVPDIPFEHLKGVQATRLGQRHKSEPVVKSLDPRGRSIYWVGPAGPEQDAGPGTDFYALRQDFAAITPIQVDLTRHSMLPELARWAEGVAW